MAVIMQRIHCHGQSLLTYVYPQTVAHSRLQVVYTGNTRSFDTGWLRLVLDKERISPARAVAL